MTIHFETFFTVEAIDRRVWNMLATEASPMMEWEYFYCLEKSGSVSSERGYRPRHIVAYDEQGPVALAPLYERDRAWVEFGDGGLIEFLTELTGLPFHSGLVGTIPFTPVPGYEFLHRPHIDPVQAYKRLLNYVDYVCEARNLSTCRIYFASPNSSDFQALLRDQGYMNLTSQYYLWFNNHYHTFDDYLGSFKSSRRTKIKRELKSIAKRGIDIRMMPGTEAPGALYENMFEFYMRTWIKYMGNGIRPFLNRTFFRMLSEVFSHRSSFSTAERLGGRPIAMALFYHKEKNIYGRYWGSFEDVPFLHFATCYYAPINYAIRNGIDVMDPGFGGEHKLIRGYDIVPVHHYIKFYGEQQRRIARLVLEQMGVSHGKF